MRILHLIAGLGIGGAEMTLCKLAKDLERRGHSNSVFSLSRAGELTHLLSDEGIPVHQLSHTRSTVSSGAQALAACVREVRRQKPDVIQTWMYHADLIGGIAGRVSGIPVVWNVRGSIEPGELAATTRMVFRACAWVSGRIPASIVSCSHSGAVMHESAGYARGKFEVIPNAVDLERFRPDRQDGSEVRRELGIAPSSFVIGMVARYHPQKDHETFLRAAADLHRTHPGVRFLLSGPGVENSSQELTNAIRTLSLTSAVVLAGVRNDVPRLLNAMDLHTLSSAYGEGCPNTLLEAMASGIPCVATDVGDSRLIVEGSGLVVPPRSPAAIAEAWRTLMSRSSEDLERLSTEVRERMASRYTPDRMTLAYVTSYERVLASSLVSAGVAAPGGPG